MNEEYLESYNVALEASIGDTIALATAWVHVGRRLHDSVGGDVESLAPELRSFIEEVEQLAEDIADSE